ncbi:biotin--[acetyl-CoA-carboxylase] ligase [Rhodobacteraceae bacterium RKSG542]|uniref:biotin--[acetyl-CoA-carboxylase] ligase n=1 Tax=Pseudovibrio flavus TaxID=2529854 RepID=UPI0012BC5921|nr:biotin--[acetyl-CoA-carboxylase] ligase [Pseudovibrio flavus]MTI16678.1 biotin--[acetyl-CoA-carboxylase] ligase [Pseudovibrio flavus]
MNYAKFKGPVPSAPGFFLEHYEELGSTNTLAMERAKAGHTGDLWVRADKQTLGRGRRGRAWTSETGNLFASVLLQLPRDAERLMQIPFVAALALAEAVEKTIGQIGVVSLKWPNDLLVDGAKISGILLESVPASDKTAYVVCGFGVNCQHHPDIEDYKVTSLRSLGYQVDTDRVFLELAASLQSWIGKWESTEGFTLVRSAWLDKAVGRGKEIRVRLSASEFKGIFIDIDDLGRLIVKREDGTTTLVTAGDVFFT